VHATADSALTVKEYNEDNNGADSDKVLKQILLKLPVTRG
jgi:hypothetical protein